MGVFVLVRKSEGEAASAALGAASVCILCFKPRRLLRDWRLLVVCPQTLALCEHLTSRCKHCRGSSCKEAASMK